MNVGVISFDQNGVYLTPHFTVDEFQAVSRVQLTVAHKDKAGYFAQRILEPARVHFGWPIQLTSFVRADGSPHNDGEALDFRPCPACATRPTAAELAQRMNDLFTWLAVNHAGAFGKLIHERDHLHVTRNNFQGAHGEVYYEPREGEYVTANIAPAVAGVGGLLLAGLAVWYVVRTKASA